MPTDLWGFVIIGGPVLFGLVLAYVMLRNRADRDPESLERTEKATRDLREQLDYEDKHGGS